VGAQANAVPCAFFQLRGAPLLHPISEHPSKEQQPLAWGSRPVLCGEGSTAKGFDQPLGGPRGLELLEVWHSLMVNVWKISG